MSALFGSMKDSALVVLALPLATVGGVVALRLLNLISFQPMDLLTMIGFIILLGLVVTTRSFWFIRHVRPSAKVQTARRGSSVAASTAAADLHEHRHQYLRHVAVGVDAR